MGLRFCFGMKVSKVKENVWKFKGVGSIYLIKGYKWVVVDAGDFSDREILAEEISKIVALDKIDVVLLTHLHYDHLGGLDLFSNAEIFASEEEIADYMEDAEGFHFFASEETDEVLRERVRPLPDIVEGLEVLKVPGHTRGSVAFLDRARKILFSGDTIFGGGIIGRTDLPNSLPEEMEESVEKLRALVKNENLALCPGHGYWEDSQV